MKSWTSYLKNSLTNNSIKEQFKPGSHLARLFFFSLVAAISIGVIYNFVSQYLTGTRASSSTVTVTTGLAGANGVAKKNFAINEKIKLNVVLTAPAGKTISQADLRMRVVGAGGGAVDYSTGQYTSTGLQANGTSIPNYFDSFILETNTPATAGNDVRLVLSARRPDAGRAPTVTVQMEFVAKTAGTVTFTVDFANMEIVGSTIGSDEPVSYTLGAGSTLSDTATIGAGATATPAPANTATPTPSAAPLSPTSMMSPTPMVTGSVSPTPSTQPGTITPTGMTSVTQVPTSTQASPTRTPTSMQATATRTPTSAQATATRVPTARPSNTTAPGNPTTSTGQTGNVRLAIKAKFNGIGANIEPVKNTVKVKVELMNNKLSQPIEKEVTFTANGKSGNNITLFEGTADFNNVPLGAGYSVYLKGDHHLQKRICQNNPSEPADGRYRCSVGQITLVSGTNNLDFSNIYLLAGDNPVSNNAQDGFVDSLDVTFIRSNLGSRDPAELAVGDLNFDGIIDTQDYALALFALSFKYDEE